METALVMPGDDLPRYPGSMRSQRRFNLPVAIVAGAAAVGSGTLFFAANRAEAQFWDPNTSVSELEILQARANGLSWGSMIMGSVAVGTGVVAVWTGAY